MVHGPLTDCGACVATDTPICAHVRTVAQMPLVSLKQKVLLLAISPQPLRLWLLSCLN